MKSKPLLTKGVLAQPGLGPDFREQLLAPRSSEITGLANWSPGFVSTLKTKAIERNQLYKSPPSDHEGPGTGQATVQASGPMVKSIKILNFARTFDTLCQYTWQPFVRNNIFIGSYGRVDIHRRTPVPQATGMDWGAQPVFQWLIRGRRQVFGVWGRSSLSCESRKWYDEVPLRGWSIGEELAWWRLRLVNYPGEQLGGGSHDCRVAPGRNGACAGREPGGDMDVFVSGCGARLCVDPV